MWQIVQETIQYMWRSEKNRLFMMITTIAILIYSLFILPNISSEQEVNIEDLEREMSGNVVQFEEALDKGLIVPSAMTGTTSYIQERSEYVNQRELLTALKQGDVLRYISISYRPDRRESSEENGLKKFVYNIFAYEEEQLYQQQKYNYYTDHVKSLSFHTIHERTSLQQLHLFFLGSGPIILFIGLIFLINDVHTKDRFLKTQKIGVPMKWQKYLLVQSLTALGFVAVFYLFLLTVFILLNGILHGFGSFDLPIGYYHASFEQGVLNAENFQLQTIGWFILRAAPYLIFLSYLFTRLNTLFSLWTGHSIITMLTGIFLITFQFIYYNHSVSEFLGIDMSNFAQTYIDFGKVLTGRFEQQIQIGIPNVFIKGIFVLVLTILITELLIYLTTKKITRQQFVS